MEDVEQMQVQIDKLAIERISVCKITADLRFMW